MKMALANRQHEAELRALARTGVMPGWIRLAFGRDPNFFHGLEVQGHFSQVVACFEAGRIIGMGCRSIRPVYINGEARDFGYLHGLRSLPGFRQAAGLARGFQFLRTLEQDRRAPAYITTISEDNAAAKAVLTGARAGLPHYIDWGLYHTHAIGLGPHRPIRPALPGITIHRGSDLPRADIARFLNSTGQNRQFFPVLDPNDFGTPRLRDFRLEDLCVACSGNAIVGTAGRWDQRQFKQIVVGGYSAPIRALRPMLNTLLSGLGFARLPAPGACLDTFFVSHVCVRRDDPVVLAALLGELFVLHPEARYHFMSIGFHETDPLRAALRPFRSLRYASRLYVVAWNPSHSDIQALDRTRVPYLELATL